MEHGCRRWAVFAVLLAFLAGGCGSGSSSSSSSASAAGSRPAKRTASYDRRASQICQAMRDRLRHLGPLPGAHFDFSRPEARLSPKAKRYFRGRETEVSRAITRLAALHAPDRERPAVERLLRTMRRTDLLEANQFRAALAGKRPGFLRASATLRPSLNAQSGAARAAHLSACALSMPT